MSQENQIELEVREAQERFAPLEVLNRQIKSRTEAVDLLADYVEKATKALHEKQPDAELAFTIEDRRDCWSAAQLIFHTTDRKLVVSPALLIDIYDTKEVADQVTDIVSQINTTNASASPATY